MTELQMGMIGLGALAVVGVMAYNKWQEVRQRKQAEQMLQASHPDVLLDGPLGAEIVTPETPVQARFEAGGSDASPADSPATVADLDTLAIKEPVLVGERREPVLILDSEPEEFAPGAPEAPFPNRFTSAEVVADSLDTVDSSPSPSIEARNAHPAGESKPTPALTVSEDLSLLSPQIDFIASIDAVEAVPGSRILEAQREALARVRKPVRWIGFNEDNGEWELVSGNSGKEYRHIRAGLQLVNRQGPASENDLAIFSVAMQDLADQLMGLVDLPPRQQALDAAVGLDEFCASVDIQIGINVISQGQAFAGTKLRALAEAAGMTIDGAKRFVRRDEEGNVLYVLLNQDSSGFSAETMKTMSTHGVTFLLDVPCVAHGERVFNQMVDLARRFADVLHGALVDDNRRPLSENALEPIRKQIVQFQAQMTAQHLPAGTPLTQRLFS